MKTAVRAAWCVLCASIGILIGSGIWKYWDYKSHPEIYIQNSAPWYTGLILNAVVTLVIAAICLIVIAVIGRKSV